MKKVLLFVALFLIPLFVSANAYTAEDLSIKYDDSNWMVFTRNNIKNNTKLKELGIDESYLNSLFVSKDIYIDAVLGANDMEYFVFIKNVKTDTNLHKFSNKDIKELENEVIKGYTTSDHGIYETGGYKYVYMCYKDQGLTIYDYYTVINAKGYTLKFQKNGDFSKVDLTTVKTVVDSVTFRLDDKYEKTPSKGIIYNAVKYGIIGAAIAGTAAAITATQKKKSQSGETPQDIQN